MPIIPVFRIGLGNAWIFMTWLLMQNFAVRLISQKLYRRLGDPPDMKPNRRRAQVNTLSMAIWLMSTIYSLFLPLQVSSVHFYIGLSVLLVSILLNIAAMVQFAVTPADQPVTTGVYRFSRHPGYVSILLTYLSIGLASASWIFLLITVIWAVLLNISVADEENYCLEKYGRAYRDYLNRTPRWIGRPGK